MTKIEIINRLINERENTLLVRKIEVKLNANSLGNPCISVGTLPYYEWNDIKEMEYCITYGRYLNCEMLVYDKATRKDKDYIFIKGKQNAITALSNILDGIMPKSTN
jgi:hypothetical protein